MFVSFMLDISAYDTHSLALFRIENECRTKCGTERKAKRNAKTKCESKNERSTKTKCRASLSQRQYERKRCNLFDGLTSPSSGGSHWFYLV